MRDWLKRNVHLLQATAWMLLTIPTLLWWKESILWVAIMSLYANIESSLAAHRAGREIEAADDPHELTLLRMERVIGQVEEVQRQLAKLPTRDEFVVEDEEPKTPA